MCSKTSTVAEQGKVCIMKIIKIQKTKIKKHGEKLFFFFFQLWANNYQFHYVIPLVRRKSCKVCDVCQSSCKLMSNEKNKNTKRRVSSAVDAPSRNQNYFHSDGLNIRRFKSSTKNSSFQFLAYARSQNIDCIIQRQNKKKCVTKRSF